VGQLMINFARRSRTYFAIGSVILTALTTSGALLLRGEAPRISARLPEPEAGGRKDGIDARLWHDPFAAIEKSADNTRKPGQEPQRSDTPNGGTPKSSPLAGETRETLVIGVMVPGAPNSAEIRRRTRFAVLAGLARKGFEAKNASRMNYFLWPQLDQDKRPSAVPAQSESTVWDNNGSERQTTPISYEWFEEVSHRYPENKKLVLVLWLNEDVFRGEPFQKLTGLERFLYGGERAGTASSFKLLGPYSSNLLRDMVNETRNFAYAPPYDKAFGQLAGRDAGPDLTDAQFYTYGAAAADEFLLRDLPGTYGTVQRLFEALGLHLRRTVATERALARGLVGELKRRNVAGRIGVDVVLISEWGGYLNQSLPTAVEQALGHPRPGDRSRLRDGHTPDWIHNLTYLPGLDGQLPEAGLAAASGSIEAPQSATELGGANLFKLRNDTRTLGSHMNQGQQDYVRRMSERLHELDNDLRREKRAIRAIGVLGNNVFDKLLILRALRPQFPDAVFFTTDFDEALTMGSELAWTRNLIVSSSFGPTLHKSIQRDIPDFRGSYQVSAFLATLLAIGDPAKNWTTPSAVLDYMSGQLLVSRIFEIERSGNVLSLGGDRLPRRVASPQDPALRQAGCGDTIEKCNGPRLIASAANVVEGRSAARSGTRTDWDCEKDADATNCGDIQPPTGKLFPRFERSSGLTLGIGLAGGALLILASLCLRMLPREASVEAWLAALALAMAASACIFWEPLAQFLTEHGNGEPLAFFQGVSIWPTVLLRGFGIVLAIYFCWRAQRSLRNNLGQMATLRLDVALPRSLGLQSFRNDIFTIGHSRGNDRAAGTAPQIIEALWRSYVGQEAFWHRLCRALSYTAVAYLIVSFVAVPIFGNPSVPARGALAASAYYWSTLLFDLLLLFVTGIVFDATFCCLRFASKLRRAGPQSPAEPTSGFDGQLRQLNLEFLAWRVRCIGALMSCPLVLIALSTVTSSTAFANYPPDLSRFVATGMSLAVVFACAVALRFEASKARATARQNLLRALVRHPLLRAMLLLGGLSCTILSENGMLPGL
jgi:hypothetical protein